MYFPKDLKKEVKKIIASIKDADAGHIWINYPYKPPRNTVDVLKDTNTGLRS